MPKTTAEENKALFLEAFDTLFNKHDIAAAERFWSPDYVQHSAHIQPGREGLFNLVRSVPETMRYENQFIVAEAIMSCSMAALVESEDPLTGSSPT
jgi:predicted SnoaL-like aldol condensation-catalyzing enzyme